ncbi:MAG TPA: energy transducer TonB, partial [Steroidobacteraceae bacterium]|nr:energy transducer TonB [Steroidobacteraceae bacterium]
MRSIARLALCLIGSLAVAADPVSSNDIKRLDERLHDVDTALAARSGSAQEPDFRGRREADDLRQWVYPDETLGKLHALQNAAATKDPEKARAALDEAMAILDASRDRAKAIETYWATGDAPHWRRHWDAFATANALPLSDTQQSLLTLEANISTLLEAGEFERAAREATPALDQELRTLMSRAQSEKAKDTPSDALAFKPRLTPCPQNKIPTEGPDSRARLTMSPPLDDYYPPSSIRREEQGDIVLRAHINESGCATDVAIVVHSGYPDLDAAALHWFESAWFIPQLKDGKPVSSEITFKIRFQLK